MSPFYFLISSYSRDARIYIYESHYKENRMNFKTLYFVTAKARTSPKTTNRYFSINIIIRYVILSLVEEKVK